MQITDNYFFKRDTMPTNHIIVLDNRPEAVQLQNGDGRNA